MSRLPVADSGSAIEARYDRDAEDYARYWGPVLERTAMRVLDRCEPHVARLASAQGDADPGVMLDIGTGTGVLAIEARRRWPTLRVIGADASAGMLSVARRRAAEEAGDGGAAPIEFLHAPADRLALPDASVDLCVSSFVFQLVPDRGAALREAHRVLRRDGLLALVTWLDRDDPFPPHDEFDEAMYDLGIDEPPEPEPEDEPRSREIRSGDFRSARSAAGELRRAGFRHVTAREERLEYRWDLESYLAYKLRYGERPLLESLGEEDRDRLVARVRERLSVLPPDAFLWSAGVVFASGRREGD